MQAPIRYGTACGSKRVSRAFLLDRSRAFLPARYRERFCIGRRTERAQRTLTYRLKIPFTLFTSVLIFERFSCFLELGFLIG